MFTQELPDGTTETVVHTGESPGPVSLNFDRSGRVVVSPGLASDVRGFLEFECTYRRDGERLLIDLEGEAADWYRQEQLVIDASMSQDGVLHLMYGSSRLVTYRRQ